MKFTVEQRHVDAAGHTARACPAARALSEALGKPVAVGISNVYDAEIPEKLFRIPDSLQTAITMYDTGQGFPTGTYTVEPITRVTVEQRHVEGAERRYGSNCPAARAISEALGEPVTVCVGVAFPEGGGKEYRLSDTFRDAYRAYDDGGEFPLGDYEIYRTDD